MLVVILAKTAVSSACVKVQVVYLLSSTISGRLQQVTVVAALNKV